VTEPIDQLRAIVDAAPPAPPALEAYLEKVRNRAYTVSDTDVTALTAAGVAEEEIFQHTAAVAIAEGLRRLDAGLKAVG
jgi:hypothetical protein